ITISQSSIANQLKATNQKIQFNELFLRTLEVGKDHIASLVNTLILVYTSSSLPLLLLFMNTNSTFWETVNREVVAQEVIQTLIASIGLIIAVPISTLIAAYFISRQKHVESDDHSGHHH
ncbi:YibE/F family protein, partial [Candidatus Dojkabacteria bacterium]|nr:YibE/F family protein [Candidatus Dojkabacteria bacterium]